MKISIIYSSRTGKTERVAQLIKEGVERVKGIDVKLMNLQDENSIDKDFINNSDGIIFGDSYLLCKYCMGIEEMD